MGTFALFADEAQELDRAGTCGTEPVRGASVKLRSFAGLEDEVVLAEDEPEASAEDERPVVSLVGAQVWLLIVGACGEDELVGLDPARASTQGQDGAPVVGG